jgi:protein involved in polysaccharide export with SLBB domain
VSLRLVIGALTGSALLGSALLESGCGAASTSPEAPPLSDEATTLGTGDVFEVRVFGEPDLSQRYRVAPDGTIDFPLIGRVEARGLQPSDLDDHITTRLREGNFLVDPQVSVFVEEYNSRRVSILGAVESSGTFPITPGMTLIEAVSQAGGFTSLANRDGTVITRRVNGRLERIGVPVDAIMDGRVADVPLRAGDVIRVPERMF